MKQWLSSLSASQQKYLIGAFIAVVIIIAAGVIVNLPEEQVPDRTFTIDMSIRQIAPEIGVTGKGLARELKLPLDTPKKKPLKKSGITQQQLDHAVEHVLSHKSTTMKYFVFAAICTLGFVYMTRLGRPDDSDISQRKHWYPRLPYIICLIAAVVFCGFLLGKSPNPMEGVVKVFKSMVGLYPSVAAKVIGFTFFMLLAVAANKIICGWACPFGALQELIYSLPILGKIKQKKLPFRLTNSARFALFFIVMLFLFGVIGGKKGFVLYHYINPFNLFNLDFDHWLILLTVIIFPLLAIIIYRPFCQFICPFGLVSWLAERVSIYRVEVDKNKCIECGACIKSCPLEAAKGKVEGKIFSADCFSCARCLNTCPVDAISYLPIWSRKSQDAPHKISKKANQTEHSRLISTQQED